MIGIYTIRTEEFIRILRATRTLIFRKPVRAADILLALWCLRFRFLFAFEEDSV